MELDFSRLDNIKGQEPSGEAPPSEESQRLPKLEWAREDHKRTLDVYQRYQDNIKKSEALRGEILKGVQAGEDTDALFLKACEAISLMTGDTLFYNQIQADTKKTQPQ